MFLFLRSSGENFRLLHNIPEQKWTGYTYRIFNICAIIIYALKHFFMISNVYIIIFKEESIDECFIEKFNEVYMELGGMGERVLG